MDEISWGIDSETPRKGKIDYFFTVDTDAMGGVESLSTVGKLLRNKFDGTDVNWMVLPKHIQVMSGNTGNLCDPMELKSLAKQLMDLSENIEGEIK